MSRWALPKLRKVTSGLNRPFSSVAGVSGEAWRGAPWERGRPPGRCGVPNRLAGRVPSRGAWHGAHAGRRVGKPALLFVENGNGVAPEAWAE